MEKQDYAIRKVNEYEDSYGIDTTESLCFIIYKKYGAIPKVGDNVTLHTRGWSFIRGIDLNGKKLFYKTDEELEQERQEWLRQDEERKQKEFAENKAQMDEQYNALPECFKKRIDRFRDNNPRFRIDYESYELFCCEQAIAIAKSCKTPEKIQMFAKTDDFKKQRKMVPDISDGHSGNTFGCAVKLAYLYLMEPENVSKIHGSLSPLVGSKDFGDVAKD